VTVSGSKVRGSRKNTGQVRSLSGQGVPETRLDNRLVGDCWVVPNSRFVGSSAGAPRGFQPTQKKKGENPFQQREERKERKERKGNHGCVWNHRTSGHRQPQTL
jgi:hypothetical protein